jgi:hypothetical protein
MIAPMPEVTKISPILCAGIVLSNAAKKYQRQRREVTPKLDRDERLGLLLQSGI